MFWVSFAFCYQALAFIKVLILKLLQIATDAFQIILLRFLRRLQAKFQFQVSKKTKQFISLHNTRYLYQPLH